MIFETPRLILRELTEEDREDLKEILQDPVAMTAYEHAFSDREVEAWLENQRRRYREDGFGLWAVIEKESRIFVGQAGLTKQEVRGEWVPEIGYLLKRQYWHHGFAAEAAAGCREYAFQTLRLPAVYSIIRESNLPSRRVARRNGMQAVDTIVKHYYGMDMPHLVYRIDNPNP